MTVTPSVCLFRRFCGYGTIGIWHQLRAALAAISGQVTEILFFGNTKLFLRGVVSDCGRLYLNPNTGCLSCRS
jgi:hypothetical protein